MTMYITLSWFSHSFTEMPLTLFIVLMIFCGIIWGFCCYLATIRQVCFSLPIVLGFALIFRIAGFYTVPFFEDDFYRYLWDGYQFATVGSPYLYSPENLFDLPTLTENLQNILYQVNYPELKTIYGPINQYIFKLAYLLGNGDLWALKLCLIAFDLACLFCLWLWIPQHKLIVFAWCPLLIKEVSMTLHADIICIFFVTFALFCLHKRYLMLSATALSLAVCAKITALILLPFFLIQRPLLQASIFISCVGLIYAPFLTNSLAGFESTAIFAKDWQFNSMMVGFLSLIVSTEMARGLSLLIFMSFYGWIWYYWFINYRHSNQINMIPGDQIFGLFLFCSPVINAWYLLWLFPFIALRFSWWSIAAITIIPLSYITGDTLLDSSLSAFQQPDWVRMVEFLVILVAINYDRILKKKLYLDYI
ncbi:MAG: hypothetical protein HN826_05635 [Methylococcales bacterium]|nr:hypothetical protein [Methylococcales bacterium]